MRHRRSAALLAAFVLCACSSNSKDATPPSGPEPFTFPPSGPSCTQSTDHTTLSLTGGPGGDLACDKVTKGTTSVTLEAQVKAHDATSLTLDTCPNQAVCAGKEARLIADAPDLDLRYVPVGTLVDVAMSMGGQTNSPTCFGAVVVTSKAAIGATKNDADAPGKLYLAVAEGWSAAMPGTTPLPFTVEEVPTKCTAAVACSAGPAPDVDYLGFRAGTNMNKVLLANGASGTLATAQPATYLLRNLRSFRKACGDDDIAWYATPK
jgi:hypothetical protein